MGKKQVDLFLFGIRAFFLLLLLVLLYFLFKLAGTISAGFRLAPVLTGGSCDIVSVGKEAAYNPQLAGGL